MAKIKAFLGMGNTDIVSVAHGGTGKSSIGNGKVLVGNSSGGFSEYDVGTSLDNPDNTHLPTTKAVSDAMSSAGLGDMLSSEWTQNGYLKEGKGGIGARGVDSTSGGTQGSNALITSGAVKAGISAETTAREDAISQLRQDFTNGCNAIASALIAQGVTPVKSGDLYSVNEILRAIELLFLNNERSYCELVMFPSSKTGGNADIHYNFAVNNAAHSAVVSNGVFQLRNPETGDIVYTKSGVSVATSSGSPYNNAVSYPKFGTLSILDKTRRVKATATDTNPDISTYRTDIKGMARISSYLYDLGVPINQSDNEVKRAKTLSEILSAIGNVKSVASKCNSYLNRTVNNVFFTVFVRGYDMNTPYHLTDTYAYADISLNLAFKERNYSYEEWEDGKQELLSYLVKKQNNGNYTINNESTLSVKLNNTSVGIPIEEFDATKAYGSLALDGNRWALVIYGNKVYHIAGDGEPHDWSYYELDARMTNISV